MHPNLDAAAIMATNLSRGVKRGSHSARWHALPLEERIKRDLESARVHEEQQAERDAKERAAHADGDAEQALGSTDPLAAAYAVNTEEGDTSNGKGTRDEDADAVLGEDGTLQAPASPPPTVEPVALPEPPPPQEKPKAKKAPKPEAMPATDDDEWEKPAPSPVQA